MLFFLSFHHGAWIASSSGIAGAMWATFEARLLLADGRYLLGRFVRGPFDNLGARMFCL
jgi:hypothetical protein